AAAGVVGVVPVGARLEGLALAGPSGPVVVVAEPDAPGALAPLMGDLAVAKLGADLKALRVALARRGVALAGPGFDVALASYCLNPSRAEHTIAALAEELLGVGRDDGADPTLAACLAAPAPHRALRASRHLAARRAPGEDRALHRRGRAHAARRAAPAAGQDPRVPRAREAQVDLRRHAPGAGRSRDRPPPHLVQPDRGRDRPALELRSEPPEHPDPQRGGAPHPRRLRRRTGPPARVGRLLADRAARAGASLGRPGADPGLRVGRGHPRAHRRGGVRGPPAGGGRRLAKVMN